MKPKTVEAYLANLEGNFAHPILTRVRSLVLETAPQITEAIKWGAPSFEYKGLMMSMVAFKNFAAVWFHKGALLEDRYNLLEASSENTKAMRKYAIASIDDLHEEGLKSLIIEAISIQDKGAQVEGFNQSNKQWEHSEILSLALGKDGDAKNHFNALPKYKQKIYIEHIESAKQQATKQRRLTKSLELIKQGKGLHDKYQK